MVNGGFLHSLGGLQAPFYSLPPEKPQKSSHKGSGQPGEEAPACSVQLGGEVPMGLVDKQANLTVQGQG